MGRASVAASRRFEVRLLAVSDVKLKRFRQLVNARDGHFGDLHRRLSAIANESGWSWAVSLGNPTIFRPQMKALTAKPFMASQPAGTAELLMDIMLAALADVGFVGNPSSTLSIHIDQVRGAISQHFGGGAGLCAAVEAGFDRAASCAGRSKFDVP